MVLAAVDWLQHRDYHSKRTCRQAALVLRFLEQATAVEGLTVDAPRSALTEADVRRFRTAAGAWRELVEKFCGDQESYRDFLEVTGKTAIPR